MYFENYDKKALANNKEIFKTQWATHDLELYVITSYLSAEHFWERRKTNIKLSFAMYCNN